MSGYRELSREIESILVAHMPDRKKVNPDARELVAAMRARCAGNESQEFLRDLRSELESWVGELQSSIATTPPPPLTDTVSADEIDIHWSSFEEEWFEIGDHTRLRMQDGQPIEIDTFSVNLDEAVTAAERAFGQPIYLVGDWIQQESGRSRALVTVSP